LSPPSLEEIRTALREKLGREIAKGTGCAWTEDLFNGLALEVFRYQAEANPVYGAFVRNRGVNPATLDDWRLIPPVPTRAFKEVPLYCAGLLPPDAVFRTSGTSRGPEARGEHRVRDLTLYRASVLATARRYLCMDPEDPTRMRVLALVPSPEARPESSLSAMVDAIASTWGDGEDSFFVDADWEIEIGRLESALREAEKHGAPVLFAGTAFAFLHWLDRRKDRAPLALPDGSVLMDTGGFKGRARQVSREALYGSLGEQLGLPLAHMVNEYGMTEMLSQFYEPVLRDERAHPLAERWHVGPPWVRTRVLDPVSLQPLGYGEVGLLSHVDLANLDSVAAILTEDLGSEKFDGFQLLGRAEGAEPRGCSLSMEDLLLAREAIL